MYRVELFYSDKLFFYKTLNNKKIINTMKINITKKQYWKLMKAVYMADWMANAICNSDMKQNDDIKEIRNYVFSFAKEMGCGDYAEYDNTLGTYYATFDMDDETTTRELINRYDDHMFWEEIADRLGERDFKKRYKQKDIKEMSNEDCFTKQMDYQIVWEKEFEKHGIDRLKIDTTKK